MYHFLLEVAAGAAAGVCATGICAWIQSSYKAHKRRHRAKARKAKAKRG